MSKIAVIGAGSVGATTAYTLVMKNLAAEVILVDINEAKEEGEVMDINERTKRLFDLSSVSSNR
ncbi:MAG: L-lactate dehydrogenase [Candidatus Yanofskybacteria bacterium GW2011_GWF1_44_227]|nr:MAG: L-lactate dehydrogenase [Candidatus Yanofskybacteria bacterium GW2011_GWF1_44_227]